MGSKPIRSILQFSRVFFFSQMKSCAMHYDAIYQPFPSQLSIFEDVGGWQPWMMMLLMMMVTMMMMTIIVMMVVMLIWGCVSLLKSKIRSKIRIIRIFRWEKKRLLLSVWRDFREEKKKEKKTEEKITEVFSVIQVCAHSDPPYPFSALALQYWIVNYLTCLKKVVFVTERSYSFETENEPVTVLL